MIIFFDTKQFSLKQWHVDHMEKIVLKFVTGLSPNATRLGEEDL